MSLAHTRTGNGEPLLLIHGLGGTMVTWDPLIERLAAERDVIAVDMPGFGASDPLPRGTAPSAANLGAAIATFVAGLGVERPHIAGNSLGAWVALEMAKRGDAASVTALSPAGLWRRPLGPRSVDTRVWGQRLRPLVWLALHSRAARERMLASTMARPENVPPGEARKLILGWLDSSGYEEANDEMRSHVFDLDGFPETVPVTIAWGEHDRLVAPPKAERRPPGSRFLVLEGCGHTPSWDDPELVTRVLLEGSSVAAVA